MRKSILLFALCLMSSGLMFGQWGGSTTTSGIIYRYGDVGIGTSSPETELHIIGPTNPGIQVESNGAGVDTWFDLGISSCNGCFSTEAETGDVVFRAAPDGSNDFLLTNPTGGNIILTTGIWANEQLAMIVNADGNVGIGTESFTDGSDTYKLSVDGRVRADAVKVYTSWADYVFEEDYYLPTLKEVKEFIAQNGHLKDIPSAAEVEVSGIELGEMNKLLLQKIEELTLYMLELKEEIEELKKS